MNASYEIYVLLLKRFLTHEISVNEFQTAFFAQFQTENADLDEALFMLLDELFGDVDSYTDDPELLAKDPEFYLDADRLRRKANDIWQRMAARREQASVLR